MFFLCFHAVSNNSVRTFLDTVKMTLVKGQLISKANCQAVNSSKKRTNEFVFTSMRPVFVCFVGRN